MLRDPHLADAGFFRAAEHPSEGATITMANPVQMSKTTVEIERLAPRLGEHSVEVLRDLGLTCERIADLLERGIAAQPAEDVPA